jgi:hypothetical protein
MPKAGRSKFPEDPFMLTYKELVELERTHRERWMLSVYIDGEVQDPAQRSEWRLKLRHSLDHIAADLAKSSHAERETFAKCRARLLEQLEPAAGALGSPGWVGFITANETLHATPLPVRMPTLATWRIGPCVAPYFRALKEAEPVIIAIADSHEVRLFRYVGRDIALLQTIGARIVDEPPLHMGRPPRTGFHSGTVGRTGTDEAQRELRATSAKLLAEAEHGIEELARGRAWIVVGGIPSVATALLRHLFPSLLRRALHASTLDVHATEAQIAATARETASALRNAYDLEQMNDVLAGGQAEGKGVTGYADCLRVLATRSVRDLYFTQRFLDDRPTDAETAVRFALECRASIEHVSGAAAERLDAQGGIAARLWYAGARLYSAEGGESTMSERATSSRVLTPP